MCPRGRYSHRTGTPTAQTQCRAGSECASGGRCLHLHSHIRERDSHRHPKRWPSKQRQPTRTIASGYWRRLSWCRCHNEKRRGHPWPQQCSNHLVQRGGGLPLWLWHVAVCSHICCRNPIHQLDNKEFRNICRKEEPGQGQCRQVNGEIQYATRIMKHFYLFCVYTTAKDRPECKSKRYKKNC